MFSFHSEKDVNFVHIIEKSCYHVPLETFGFGTMKKTNIDKLFILQNKTNERLIIFLEKTEDFGSFINRRETKVA